MKLRNKKTGEIKDVESLGHEKWLRDEYGPQITLSWNTEYENLGECRTYNSLSELNEEWEDYEEPKEYWYIDPMVCGVYCTKIKKDEDLYDFNKQIGNYFLLREEAEKAVEKLKAYKRLKDRGFKFDGYNACSVDYDIDEQYRKNISQDLDLLFGGEE